MKRSIPITLVATLILLLVAIGAASSADSDVRTRGDVRMVPNALIQSTLKFAPGNLVAASGAEATWAHSDKSGEPHTITIVNQEELPTNVEEVFEPDCPSCDAAGEGHFGAGFNPVVDIDGDGGLNAPGDSLFLPPGGEVTATITAEAGTTLSYLCIIHPWMQGTVDVK